MKKTFDAMAFLDSMELRIEVDYDVLTVELATEINNFWTSADARLAEANDDVQLAVIRMAARHLFYGLAQADIPRREPFKDQEGWPEDTGIRLVSDSGDLEIADSDISLTEVA